MNEHARLDLERGTVRSVSSEELQVPRKPPFSKISIIGLGYIGLPTAAMFASRRIEVLGVDISKHVVDRVNDGQIHIVEPDLDIVVGAAVTKGFLRASLVPEEAEAFLIAVPTPFKTDSHEPDLTFVLAATEAIAPVLRAGNLVIIESTIPVGSTEAVAEKLAMARPDLTFPQSHGNESDIHIAHCPERVLPGKVMQELILNDRLIGGMTSKSNELAIKLYRSFVVGECITTDPRSAELAKLSENSFRDVNIGFANELSVICDKLGVDVWEVIGLANRHPRVNILNPGPGVGGHCIAVDPWFIVASAPEESRIIRAAREVNECKPDWVICKVLEMVQQFLKDSPNASENEITLACYGLTFKPDIDDLRESPALSIQKTLQEKFSGRLLAVEPNIEKLPEGFEQVELVSYSHALINADVHVLLVGHRLFREAGLPAKYLVKSVEI